MIDTDKYEGHEFLNDDNIEHYQLTDVDYQMLREAPLLLAEVKRLREGIKRIADLAVQRNARHTEKSLLELIE
jgi:hypothetical protein